MTTSLAQAARSFAAGLALSAAVVPAGWRHVMSVTDAHGQTIKAVADLDARPRTLLRTDGVQVPGFTPEDGIRIAAALRDAGLDDDRILAQHLLGVAASANLARGQADQAQGQQGRACPLTLDIAGTSIKVRLKGGYVPYVIDPDTMQRVRRFSVDDAVTVKQAIEAAGYGDAEVMSVWLGLVDATPTVTEQVGGTYRDFAIGHDDPLKPGCGQCLAGRHCSGDCCSGGPVQCESCKACP